jgi:hypothetical protein
MMAERPTDGEATGEEATALGEHGGGDDVTGEIDAVRPVPSKAKAPLTSGTSDTPLTTDTAEVPVADVRAATAFDDLEDWDDDEEEERARRESHHRKQRARRVTGVLALVAAIGVGFLGGILYQKNEGSSSSTTGSSFAALAKRFSAGGAGHTGGSRTGGFGGFAGFGGGATGSVVGTVTSISGGTLYMSEGTSNALVKVETSPSSTVTAPTTTSVSSIQPGDSVTISGAKQKDGSYMAATITDSGTSTTGSSTAAPAGG